MWAEGGRKAHERYIKMFEAKGAKSVSVAGVWQCTHACQNVHVGARGAALESMS